MQIGASVARRFVLERQDEYDLPGVERYVALDTRLNRLVNVDLITATAPSAVIAAAGRARVLRDKRLARIVAVGRERDEATKKSVPYVITERPAGVHVQDLLGAVQFVPITAAALVGEAAAGLQAAALAGEHHGQIRPRALTVTESGRVIVSGFGIDGELKAQAGATRGRDQKSDARALAKIYLTALTGLDADQVTVEDLPDDVPAAGRKLATAAIKGSGPKSLAEIIAALGTGNTAVLRVMAAEAPSLWWPAPPLLEAPAEVDLVGNEAVAFPEVVADPADDTEPQFVVTESPTSTDEIPIARPKTRFGGAVDDIAEFHDIVAEQNTHDKPAVLEVLFNRLEKRFPASAPLARVAQAVRTRAHTQAPINAAPLLIGLSLTVVFVVTIVAISTMGKTYLPDERIYQNPQNTYPVFTFGPDAPVSQEPAADE